MAGVPGFEPGPKVLETSMLTVNTIPLNEIMNDECRMMNKFEFIILQSEFIIYLLSLCIVWQRQRRQNFLNSSRLGVLFLFLVVT
jgi:hypothetical protein